MSPESAPWEAGQVIRAKQINISPKNISDIFFIYIHSYAMNILLCNNSIFAFLHPQQVTHLQCGALG
jgi:hypothetical protein